MCSNNGKFGSTITSIDNESKLRDYNVQSQFLRKLSRSRGSDDADPADSYEDQAYFQEQQPKRRAGSEPTEQLLSTIPSHVRNQYALVRNPSSADSQFPGASDSELATASSCDDPLGLSLHHNSSEPDADFIFVHGLGGSSQKTWSLRRDIRNFWPSWLPSEPELSNVRIFSFGYNANFRGPNTSLNITDFAKDLLLRMLTFTGPPDADPSIRVGQHPIVFVVHSMGGLVVKKAYILGKHDVQYSGMISQVRAIAFLATPHRGSNYAKILNQILTASPFGTSQKEYIAELEATSSTIQDINDQFRTVCAELILVSFYETMKTSLGRGIKRTIVEKVSAVLDYPQEHSSPLNADHHTICKFENQRDENYVCVRNMLRLIMSKLPSKRHKQRRPTTVENIKRLEDILGIHEDPAQDFNACKSRLSEGSCQWILRKQSFRDWTDGSETDPNIFWLTGLPATGKSTLSSFVVDWLKEGFLESSCQYHFFLSDHQAKRTVAYFLRIMAFQLAQSHDAIQDALFKLSDETNVTFGQQSSGIIWEKVFQGIIFRIPLDGVLYWVLDALDEADGAVTLANMLLKIRSVNPIKLFITSRKTKDLSNFINAQSTRLIHQGLSIADTSEDIVAYVSRTVRANLPQDKDTQDGVIQQILVKASGSFLWVKLTLDAVRDNWHTKEDIRRAMMEVPAGMELLYKRMLGNVTRQSDRNREIAREILTWAVCSFRPLRLLELQAALRPRVEGFVSLEDTIGQICGNFINVNNDQITLVHATARHFLLHESDDFINKDESHEHLALACMKFLSDDSWKNVFALRPKGYHATDRTKEIHLDQYEHDHPFLCYATEHWAYHVNCSPTDSEDLWKALEEFFQMYALTWIHAVALSMNLRTLTRTAQYLRAFCHRKAQAKADVTEPPRSLTIQDSQWLRLWTVDLIRTVGKFGRILLQNPSSIYRLIPVLCPPQSQIGGIYGRPRDFAMSLSGLSSANWDDCLARVSASEDETVSRILATDTCFITLMSNSGKAIVWSVETCEELRRISHGEYVTHMAIDKLGTVLATAGVRTIQTWEISSGKQIHCFPRNSEAKTMTLIFGDSKSTLIIGREDYSVQCYNLKSGELKRTFWALARHTVPQNCPRLMVLSPDTSKVTVAERGKPVLIWDLAQPQDQRPWRCVRKEDITRHLDKQEAWNAPEVVCWHPEGTSILILYQDSTVVHWNFTDEEQTEHAHIGAREMVVSKDGSFLLTSDSNGTLSVWAFPRFNLVYRLFYEEFVRDLAFSPDGQRIYDCRGSLCNVWEPDVLVRHEEVGRDDTSSNHESSILSDPVISQDDNSRSQITALVCDKDDKFFCCGRDDGTVTIHDAMKGKRVRKVYGHSATVSIIALEWSQSGKFMVSGDDAGRVVCKRLDTKEAGKWAVFPVLDFRLHDPVRQFIFHPDESLLLVSTESMDILWNIHPKTKKELCRKTWPHCTGRRWITHPLDPSKLLWIDPDTSKVFEWDSLQPSTSCSSSSSQAIETEPESSRPHLHTTPSGSPEGVRWISPTRNARYVICETLPDTGHARSLSPRGLRAQLIVSDPKSKHPFQYTSKRQPLEELATLSTRLLGLFQERVIFLDSMFWICSWELGASARAIKKHFFLPQDWASPASLQLVVCNEQGSFFCPRNGEVAIVRNGIRL